MLIVSKFKDYYDSAVGQGIDKTIVYDRQEQHFEFKEPIIYFPWDAGDYKPEWRRNNRITMNGNWKIVGFCGKVYIGLETYTFGGYEHNGYRMGENEHHWGEKAIEKILELNEKYDQRYGKGNEKKLREFINHWHGKEMTELFFKYKTPIFKTAFRREPNSFGRSQEVTFDINPNLKSLEFFKQFDSYTAFQEIQMFISGVLGVGEKEPNSRTDIEKVESHGFDKKWSFRNPEPPKRKQK